MFSFVQITDHHLTESESTLVRGFSSWYSYRTVLKHIAEHVGDKIDFVVSMGDLVDPPSEAGYRAVLRALGAEPSTARAPGPLWVTGEGLPGLPMYVMPGNHDDPGSMYRALFPGDAPMERMNMLFEHKGIRFVCLDWGRDPDAVSTPELFAFLEGQLADGAPAIILTHHHIHPIGVPWLDAFLAPDAARAWELMSGKNVLGVLAGHVHMTTERLVAGVPVLTLRSTSVQFAPNDGSAPVLAPPHYRLVTVHDGTITSRVYEVTL